METNRDQLAQGAPFDLRRHGADVRGEAQPDDNDPGEATEVLLYVATLLGLVLVVAVVVAVWFGLRALRHW